jgi:hypothetical protein
MKKTTKSGALHAMYAKPNGRERSINDFVYFGVGDTPYADVYDLKNAGCKFTPGKNNPRWGHLHDKKEGAKFLDYIFKKDGFLYIDR